MTAARLVLVGLALGLAGGSGGAQGQQFDCTSLHANNGAPIGGFVSVEPASGTAGTAVTITGSWLHGVDDVILGMNPEDGDVFGLADLDLRAICVWSFDSDHEQHADAAYHGPVAGQVEPDPDAPCTGSSHRVLCTVPLRQATEAFDGLDEMPSEGETVRVAVAIWSGRSSTQYPNASRACRTEERGSFMYTTAAPTAVLTAAPSSPTASPTAVTPRICIAFDQLAATFPAGTEPYDITLVGATADCETRCDDDHACQFFQYSPQFSNAGQVVCKMFGYGITAAELVPESTSETEHRIFRCVTSDGTSPPTTSVPTRSPTTAPTAAPATYTPTVAPTAAPRTSAPTTYMPTTTRPNPSPTTVPSSAPTVPPTPSPTPESTTESPTTTLPITALPTTVPSSAPAVPPTPSPTPESTTPSPTTTLPTTVSPTTALPTTFPPATSAPTTALPTTFPPTTAQPTAAAPAGGGLAGAAITAGPSAAPTILADLRSGTGGAGAASTVASSSLLWVAVLLLVLLAIAATVVISRRLRKRREEARDARVIARPSGGAPIPGDLPAVPAPHVVLNQTLSPFGGGFAAPSAAALGHGNQTTNAAFHIKPVVGGGMDRHVVPRPLSLVLSAASEAGLAVPPTAAPVVPSKGIRRNNNNNHGKSMKDLGLPPPAFQRPPSFGDVGNDECVSTEATGGISVPPTRHGTEAPNRMPDYAAVNYADVVCDDLPDYAAPDNQNEYAVPVAPATLSATSLATSLSPYLDADHIYPHHGELPGGSSEMYALPGCQNTLAGTDGSNGSTPETKNADYTYAHSAGVGVELPEYMVPSTHNPDYTPTAAADAEYADVDYTDVPGSSADPSLRTAKAPDTLPQHQAAAIVSIGAHLASGSPSHLGPRHHLADHLADHTYEYCEPKLLLEQATGSAARGNDDNMSRM